MDLGTGLEELFFQKANQALGCTLDVQFLASAAIHGIKASMLLVTSRHGGDVVSLATRYLEDVTETQVRKALFSSNRAGTLRKLLKSLAATNDTKALVKVIGRVARAHGGGARVLSHYTIGITACAGNKLWQHACKLFAAMPTSKVAPNAT
eukprot:Skav230469  [mRNA]  locus=scaffold186:542335:544046:+ [translate_table: standard]